MTTNRLIKTILILSIVIINIGCDQVSKKIVRQNINPYQTIQLLSNHLTLTRVENTGAFLSTGDSLPKTAKNILLSLLPLLAIALGLIFILSKQNISNGMLAGFCFVIGGGIGNIFDRIMHGSVTDFLHIKFGGFQTGIFNMADMSIMVGVAIILIQSFFRKKQD
jgi:signal peptidase II